MVALCGLIAGLWAVGCASANEAADAGPDAAGDAELDAVGDAAGDAAADPEGDAAGDATTGDASDAAPDTADAGAAEVDDAACTEGAARATDTLCVAEICTGGAWVKGKAPAGAACDDGVKCTYGTTCQGDGTCGGGAWTCVCKPDAPVGDALHCGSKDPSDKCKGKNVCHLNDTDQYVCEIDPATVANCPSDQDTACLKNWCDPKDGTCALTPVEVINKSPTTMMKWSLACEDEEGACTTNDTCSAGVCEAGALLCECTVKDLSICKTSKGLKDDPCLGKVICKNPGVGPYGYKDPPELKAQKTHCAIDPATVVTCPTTKDTECASNKCKVAGAVGSCVMTPINTGNLCDDGDPCTINEACNDKGVCGSEGAFQVCACKADADCAAQENGNGCDGTLVCDKAMGACVVNPASVVGPCPTANDTKCLVNICYPALGVCKLTPSENISTEKLPNGIETSIPYPVKKKNVYCEDGNKCTPVDECDKGVCVSDSTYLFPCGACTKDADCASADDGNPCNGTLACKSGLCETNPASAVDCSSTTSACVAGVCDPANGACVAKPYALGTQCKTKATCSVADGKCDGAGACKGTGVSCQ